MPLYNIGQEPPFRLTRSSSLKLLTAILETGSKLQTMFKDTGLPYTHIIAQIDIPPGGVDTFKKILGAPVTLAYSAGGGGGNWTT